MSRIVAQHTRNAIHILLQTSLSQACVTRIINGRELSTYIASNMLNNLFHISQISVVDPDPYVFGLPDPHYLYGSGSAHHQAKN
jgi:hypothetical protein